MAIFHSWNQIGSLLRRLTAAGPLVQPSVATASVERLRRAHVWAQPRVAKLSGLENVTAAELDVPMRVVDRFGLIASICQTLDDSRGEARHGALPTFIALSGTAVLWRMAPTIQSFQTFGDRHTMLLVAPNVLQVSNKLSLDQNDYAKWVALRAGIWSLYFQRATWLPAYEMRQLDNLPRSAGEIARNLVLLSQLVDARLMAVDAQEISSVHWIRRHHPRPGLTQAAEQLWRARSTPPDVHSLGQQSRSFIAETKLNKNPQLLDALLASPDCFPTENELAQPDEWLRRMNGF